METEPHKLYKVYIRLEDKIFTNIHTTLDKSKSAARIAHFNTQVTLNT